MHLVNRTTEITGTTRMAEIRASANQAVRLFFAARICRNVPLDDLESDIQFLTIIPPA